MFQSDIERAEELVSSGQQLLHSRHYCALDCVQPKCTELQRMCQLLSERLESRLNTLSKCRDLQERIDKVPESESFLHCRNFKVTKNDFHNLYSYELILLGWLPNRLVWQYCTGLLFKEVSNSNIWLKTPTVSPPSFPGVAGIALWSRLPPLIKSVNDVCLSELWSLNHSWMTECCYGLSEMCYCCVQW